MHYNSVALRLRTLIEETVFFGNLNTGHQISTTLSCCHQTTGPYNNRDSLSRVGILPLCCKYKMTCRRIVLYYPNQFQSGIPYQLMQTAIGNKMLIILIVLPSGGKFHDLIQSIPESRRLRDLIVADNDGIGNTCGIPEQLNPLILIDLVQNIRQYGMIKMRIALNNNRIDACMMVRDLFIRIPRQCLIGPIEISIPTTFEHLSATKKESLPVPHPISITVEFGGINSLICLNMRS